MQGWYLSLFGSRYEIHGVVHESRTNGQTRRMALMAAPWFFRLLPASHSSYNDQGHQYNWKGPRLFNYKIPLRVIMVDAGHHLVRTLNTWLRGDVEISSSCTE